MTLQIAQQIDRTDVVIFSDSQAAVKAITGPPTSRNNSYMAITESNELRFRGVRIAIY